MIVYIAGYQQDILPENNYKVWDKRENPSAPIVSEMPGQEILTLLKSKRAKFEYGKTDYSKFITPAPAPEKETTP